MKKKEKIQEAELKRKHSDDFRTPERPTSSLKSDSASPASTGTGSEKVQFSLKKFWGSPEQQASDSPVLVGLQLGKTRVQKSQEMQQLVETRKEFQGEASSLKGFGKTRFSE